MASSNSNSNGTGRGKKAKKDPNKRPKRPTEATGYGLFAKENKKVVGQILDNEAKFLEAMQRYAPNLVAAGGIPPVSSRLARYSMIMSAKWRQDLLADERAQWNQRAEPANQAYKAKLAIWTRDYGTLRPKLAKKKSKPAPPLPQEEEEEDEETADEKEPAKLQPRSHGGALDTILECVVCCEKYTWPDRALVLFIPCGHKTCKKCAEDLRGRRQGCPTCNEPFAIMDPQLTKSLTLEFHQVASAMEEQPPQPQAEAKKKNKKRRREEEEDGKNEDDDHQSVNKKKHKSKREEEDEKKVTKKWQVGDHVDAQDKQGKWYLAKIKDIQSSGGQVYLVHFVGWNNDHDEWVLGDRLVEPGTRSRHDDYAETLAALIVAKIVTPNKNEIQISNWNDLLVWAAVHLSPDIRHYMPLKFLEAVSIRLAHSYDWLLLLDQQAQAAKLVHVTMPDTPKLRVQFNGGQATLCPVS